MKTANQPVRWNVEPEVFQWGWFAPRWYGLFFAVGFLAGFFIVRRMFQREGKPARDLDVLLTYVLAGTLVGARLGHVLFYHPSYYFEHPLEIPQI
jgi:prolipoprotein diacylglyceryltransferase